MVLIMFRNGGIEEVESCSDVVHKEGSVICIDHRGRPVASFRDVDLLYYTLNPQCIQTIRGLKAPHAREEEASERRHFQLGRLFSRQSRRRRAS